jgi:outer membrane protein assembly factor BamB
MPTVIYSDVVYAKEYDILWDLNDDFSRFGGFKTVEDANQDAASKHYTNITIRKIISDKGVIYFTYRVNQNNDFVCGILAPKVPKYGLIRGG